jgi:c(7)-type cytochrome triheme protein
MKILYLSFVLAAGCSSSATPEQPLPFSHALHTGQQGIACVACHEGSKTRAQAGLPSIGICLSCHMRPQGATTVNDQVVRERAALGGAFRWVQVTRNPGHVYFSHRAHTAFAKMNCSECHGEVSTWAEPPTQPKQELVDMAACMSCHRQRGASNECKTCHR